VLWAGLIPPELDLAAWSERLEGAALTLVIGDKDEFSSPALLATEAERLSSAGLAYSLQRFDGGHVIDAGALQSLAAGFAGH
jgi:predicted esterase